MTKPFLLSAAIHVLILGSLILIGSIDRPVELTVDTISIRIMNRRESNLNTGRFQASAPSESYRQVRQSASIPQDQVMHKSIGGSPVISNSSISQNNIELSYIKISEPPQAPVHESVITGTSGGVDPLAGLEEAVPGIKNESDANSNPWSLSWANGTERGILSFPMIDVNDFPEETEKLLNVLVRIRVSPQGDVISAEVNPPGSGDIRIDRYMHNVALQLVLEPWPDDESIQEASLQLLFLDGGR